MIKEWFLKCLSDPWIFKSVREFQYSVQGGGIIEYDGCGKLLFIDKRTLKVEEGESCFKDGIDVWKITEDEDSVGVPEETIERIISHFSDRKRQLIGVMWYNR